MSHWDKNVPLRQKISPEFSEKADHKKLFLLLFEQEVTALHCRSKSSGRKKIQSEIKLQNCRLLKKTDTCLKSANACIGFRTGVFFHFGGRLESLTEWNFWSRKCSSGDRKNPCCRWVNIPVARSPVAVTAS